MFTWERKKKIIWSKANCKEPVNVEKLCLYLFLCPTQSRRESYWTKIYDTLSGGGLTSFCEGVLGSESQFVSTNQINISTHFLINLATQFADDRRL